MKEQQTISSRQMAILLFAFMTGSSIINVPAPLIGIAQNGSWISLLISMVFGMLILTCVLYLYRKHPNMTFVDYSRKTVGNTLTVLLAIPFIITLFLIISYIVLDVGGFMVSTMMRETPLYMFHSLIILTSAMTIRAGLEVMTRIFVIFICFLLGFVGIILLLSIPNYHPEFVLPILPDGIMPVIHGGYFTFGFPYSEIIIFTMVFPFMKEEKKTKMARYMYTAIILNVIVLIIATICTIMAFGPIAGEMKYSLYSLSRLINIGEFLTRIESVIGISLIAGSYMKATIALFVLNLMITKLFKLKDNKILIFPISIICFLLTLVMFDNESELVEKVLVVLPLTHLTYTVTPVLLVTIATMFKRK
ncbi:GerAB/ArcD/ProY family transporter [Bacillus solitudinis]|uniref:GerAB/ArcD/ProY family transporter n=1 Tax=Bacillus solitudinis TaxID=2014074 RepID=UPI000C232A46|nr:endospore germination permease [Bacillus solitudinis]